MKTEAFQFQIVTPMFLGGADQKAEAIRPSSIKGALRFWWRALNWGRCLNEKGDEVQALRHLHAEEARLFGAAAKTDEKGNQIGGQGVFLMQVVQDKTRTFDWTPQQLKPGHIYLLGLGLAEYVKEAKETRIKTGRNALQKGGTFTLKLIFHPKASDQDRKQICDAVQAFELLGALGSRARHGMGSVASTKVMTRADYEKAVKDLLQGVAQTKDLPLFTAFSSYTRLDFSNTHTDALQLLDAVGREQQMYRSYGQNGMVNGQKAQQLFHDDHDLIFNALNGNTPPQHPKRVVFGLPHNYFFSSTRKNAAVNYAPDGQEGRRASPLLLHIHPVSDGDGGFVAVHTLMRARFLPQGAQIRIKAGREFNPRANPDWSVLHDYLDRFTDKKEVIRGKR